MAPRVERTPREPSRALAARDAMPNLRELAEGLSIDQHALDEALIKNGQLFHEIADACALALSRRDAAKDELKVTEAEVDQSIRVGMSKDGTKLTADNIMRMIIVHKDVVAATARLRNRDEDLARLTALKESYTQRSYAIKDLVSLHLAAYFNTTGQTIRRDVNSAGSDARHAQIRKDQTDHRLRNRDERRS